MQQKPQHGKPRVEYICKVSGIFLQFLNSSFLILLVDSHMFCLSQMLLLLELFAGCGKSWRIPC
jgi:hypothetical protein